MVLMGFRGGERRESGGWRKSGALTCLLPKVRDALNCKLSPMASLYNN